MPFIASMAAVLVLRASSSPFLPEAPTMPFPTRRLTHFLLATIATVAALGLGACSRSQHITDSLTGLRADGAASFAAGGNGHGRGHGQKPPPPPPGGSANPCVSLTGLGGTVVNASAGIVQFRATRLRIDVTGDVDPEPRRDRKSTRLDSSPRTEIRM